MRRFPLRLKIAGFAAGLILLATALVALFTVILPWRAKLKAQEQIASQLVKTALPLGIDLRADGAHFDPARVHAELGELVAGTKPGRRSRDEITLYKSVGVAVQDAAAAALVLAAARERSVGREIELEGAE